MQAPSTIRLKRPFSDLAPDTLILDSTSSDRPSKKLYVLDRRDEDARWTATRPAPPPTTPDLPAAAAGLRRSSADQPRRTFHLSQAGKGAGGTKRGRSEDDVATFQEDRTKVQRLRNARDTTAGEIGNYTDPSTPARPLKRPGRGAAVRPPADHVVRDAASAAAEQQHQMQQLADYMHQAALDEVRREAAARPVPRPNLSGERSRELHRQRAAANASCKHPDMDESGQPYVYDTYVLAPASEMDSLHNDASVADFDNVGYLVIAEEDQSLWATYAEGELSDADEHSDGDDDDENAEDFYGADYPEDELASDDEFDRDVYGYRDRRGSDDEEWDAEYSADEDGGTQPFGLKAALMSSTLRPPEATGHIS